MVALGSTITPCVLIMCDTKARKQIVSVYVYGTAEADGPHNFSVDYLSMCSESMSLSHSHAKREIIRRINRNRKTSSFARLVSEDFDGCWTVGSQECWTTKKILVTMK